MSESSPLVKVHVNIDISAASLKAVVANVKHLAGADEGERKRMDSADWLAALISRFLEEKDFLAYARNMDNY
jgi:hypothetical protein